ncbi:MAG: DUF1269 domain-containing protein [Mycobacterium sp.]
MDEEKALHQEHQLVIVAGYRDLEIARRDFAKLTEEVEHERFLVKGAALLTRDADGTPTVVELGNHLGLKGAGFGAGIGILVGFFAPPIMGSILLGAAAGALVAAFASHEVKIGLRHEISRALEAGTGAVVALVPPSSLVFAERDLTGAVTKSIVPMDKSTLNTLEREIARALHEHQAAHGANPDSVGTNT